MRLKNKKTGEIVEWFNNTDGVFPNSLAELNEEWEDYEEPKEYWYIDIDGERLSDNVEDDTVKVMREIGNYFETKEEAELAVRKLKAWRRLRDKGFRFNDYIRDAIYYEISDEEIEKDAVREDLDLLFGGEE